MLEDAPLPASVVQERVWQQVGSELVDPIIRRETGSAWQQDTQAAALAQYVPVSAYLSQSLAAMWAGCLSTSPCDTALHCEAAAAVHHSGLAPGADKVALQIWPEQAVHAAGPLGA